jgi:hypothetical protein
MTKQRDAFNVWWLGAGFLLLFLFVRVSCDIINHILQQYYYRL